MQRVIIGIKAEVSDDGQRLYSWCVQLNDLRDSLQLQPLLSISTRMRCERSKNYNEEKNFQIEKQQTDRRCVRWDCRIPENTSRAGALDLRRPYLIQGRRSGTLFPGIPAHT